MGLGRSWRGEVIYRKGVVDHTGGVGRERSYVGGLVGHIGGVGVGGGGEEVGEGEREDRNDEHMFSCLKFSNK